MNIHQSNSVNFKTVNIPQWAAECIVHRAERRRPAIHNIGRGEGGHSSP